jgi:hypothetical protein
MRDLRALDMLKATKTAMLPTTMRIRRIHKKANCSVYNNKWPKKKKRHKKSTNNNSKQKFNNHNRKTKTEWLLLLLRPDIISIVLCPFRTRAAAGRETFSLVFCVCVLYNLRSSNSLENL